MGSLNPIPELDLKSRADYPSQIRGSGCPAPRTTLQKGKMRGQELLVDCKYKIQEKGVKSEGWARREDIIVSLKAWVARVMMRAGITLRCAKECYQSAEISPRVTGKVDLRIGQK